MPLPDANLLSELCKEACSSNILTECIVGGAKSRLVECGILVRNGETDTWETQDEPYFTPIMHDRLGRPFYTDGAKHVLTNDDIQLWRADPSRIAESVGEAFGCNDHIRDVIPGQMWNLGQSSQTLGRSSARDVYFATRVESGKCEELGKLPKDARSYILIAGWINPDGDYDKDTERHMFALGEAVSFDGCGKMEANLGRINQRFAPETAPQKRKPNAAAEKKKLRLAHVFYDLCFALRKTEDYGRLCEERKRLESDKAICDETGFDRNFVSRTISESAVKSGKADPVAAFWRGVFMDQEKFDLFNDWLVKTNVGMKQKLGPVLLKEEVEKYMNLQAVNAARKMRK